MIYYGRPFWVQVVMIYLGFVSLGRSSRDLLRLWVVDPDDNYSLRFCCLSPKSDVLFGFRLLDLSSDNLSRLRLWSVIANDLLRFRRIG